MEQNEKCPACGGIVSPYDYVCDFCGQVLFKNIKTTDNLTENNFSFEEGMGIIKQNLDALHDIPKPGFGNVLMASIRVLLALYTFGIVLIFWRRPKKRFNNEVYNKLRNIIVRNISFLKISSKGNHDLMARVDVFEKEFKHSDKKIQQGIRAKNIAYIIVFTLFASWLIYVISSGPRTHSTYSVTAYDTLIQGNLSNHVYLTRDTSIIKHRLSGESFEWEMEVKMKIFKLETAQVQNTRFRVNLLLTDERGIPVVGFEPAEISEQSKEMFRSQIINKEQSINYYRFYFKNDFSHPEYGDTIPIHASRFIVRADTFQHVN